MYYNRSGRKIATVTHAVALLGLDAIRDIAGGMLLFRHFQGKSAGLRQLMLLSLLSASHARVTATRVEFPRIEEAYLCGMFRNLGEVLTAGYLPRKHAAVLARMRKASGGEHAACLQVLHCSYEDLGRAAARHWRMPEQVWQCMQAEPSSPRRSTQQDFDTLVAVTAFSHELTEAVHRRDVPAQKGRLDYLLTKHGPRLSLSRSDIQKIADIAIDETKATFDLLKIRLDDLRLRKQAAEALRLLADSDGGEFDDEFEEGESRPALLRRLVDEVEGVLRSGDVGDLTRFLLMVLEAVYRGVGAKRVVFALRTPDHQNMVGRLGLGEDIDRYLSDFSFPLSIRSGPVAVAMLGRQPLFVHDDRYSDTAFCEVTRAKSFGILPLVVDGLSVGCLFLERKQDDAGPLDEKIVEQLARLQDISAEGIRRMRRLDEVSV
jgi:HD-like signal output (HDOD) protein